MQRSFYSCVILLSVLSAHLLAIPLGDVFDRMSSFVPAIGQLITGISYLSGIGFGVAAIFKFKQHKDNPQQNPAGTPVTMMALSTALIFLPGLYKPMGQTMFGSKTGALKTYHSSLHEDYFKY